MVERRTIDIQSVFAVHPFAEGLLRRLEGAGHRAVLIGGVVRDGLLVKLGRSVPFPPEDIDVATSALPNEVRDIFSDVTIVGVGEEFGVLRVVAPDGQVYEVATFRTEDEYDGRWPGRVDLVRDLDGDVHRRDLTINGLAATREGEVIDLVGGIADLEAGRIRAIGDPVKRFGEDYLRMLRAVRFACQVDGELDAETALAIASHADRIKSISNERVGEELMRLLKTPRAARGLSLLDELGLLSHLLPELTGCKGVPQPEEYHPEGDVFVHTLKAVRVADALVDDPVVKLAVVLHDIGKPDALVRSGGANMGGHCAVGARMARDVGRRLRLSRATIARVEYLVRHHMRIAAFPEMGRGKQVRFVSEGSDPSGTTLRERYPLFFDLLQLLVVDCEASAHRASGWAPILRETLEVVEHIDLVCGLKRARELISGHDLVKLGLHPGQQLGATLDAIHDQILAGRLESREEALEEAQRRIDQAKAS